MKIKINSSNFLLPALVVIALGLNVILFYFGRGISLQVSTIAFVLVWLNFILGIVTFRRQKELAYILLGAMFIIEFLLAVDLFWVIGRVM